MNLRDLAYLVAVADERHFGRAAAASFVSQPTLSTQIKKLERELGVELLERNHRQVILTPAGEQIVERARVILREVGVIQQLADQARDPESGSVRIGLFPTLGPYLLPHVVPKVRDRFPNLELLLVEETTDHVLEHVRDGSLDAGVLALPFRDEHLHLEPLFEEHFVLAVPKGHPLAERGEPVEPQVLVNESVLLLEEGHCLRDQALEVCHLVGASERDGFRATSLETLRQMVAARVGVTLLPMLAVSPPVPVSEEITLLPFREPVPHRRVVMCWRDTSARREFLPELAQLFGDLPPGLVHDQRRPR